MAELLNLVPPNKRGGMFKRTEVEVAVFHTQHEYDTCELESEFKKRIWAKFRGYDDGLEYANKLAKSSLYHKIIIRA